MSVKRTATGGTKRKARRNSPGNAAISARRYTVVYEAVSPEDGGGFYAHIPALDITTEGETLKEAKEMARDAIECFLEAARTIGQMIPEEVTSETVEIAV